MPNADSRLRDLAASHRRVTLGLTLAMVSVYFGFILLIAYGRSLLSALIAPGLTLGILLGVVVIVAAWLLTWVYVWWANRHYDAAARRLRESE
jgi:uncharacterized membrane protein (DUF485 family)